MGRALLRLPYFDDPSQRFYATTQARLGGVAPLNFSSEASGFHPHLKRGSLPQRLPVRFGFSFPRRHALQLMPCLLLGPCIDRSEGLSHGYGTIHLLPHQPRSDA